jgi:IS30 family transposase
VEKWRLQHPHDTPPFRFAPSPTFGHSSKGGVENANGRLRRWLPRHIDIDQISDEEIQDIVMTANLRPRKCLGFKTPFQAILKELGNDVQIRFS